MHDPHSGVLQLVRSRASYPAVSSKDISSTCHRWWGVKGRASLPPPYHHKEDEKQGYVFSAKVLGASLPVSPMIGSALLCCPGKMQGLLSWVLQPVWADQFSCSLHPRTNFPTCNRVQREGEASLSATLPYYRWVVGQVLPWSHSLVAHLHQHWQCQLYCAAQASCKAYSPECCCQLWAEPARGRANSVCPCPFSFQG